jgi:multidrug resistance efflux pump
MKMEFPLRSPRDGVVAEVAVSIGDHVGLDAAVVRLEAPPAVVVGQVAEDGGATR